MNFLNLPLLKLGLIAVIVPILIHLLNRRKIQPVTWAAMKYLQISIDQNRRRLRVEDVLLLVLRCALLALIAVTLSRPTLGCAQHSLGASHEITAVIILDNSYSMSCIEGASSRFEQAKTAAGQLLDSLPTGSSVALILAADHAQQVIAEPSRDLVKVRHAISQSALTSRGSNLYPALQQAVQTLSGRDAGRKEIHLITDGQLSAFGRNDEIYKLLEQQQKDIQTHIVLVSSNEQQNLAIIDMRQANGVTAVGREVRFDIDVKNFGTQTAENVRVLLRVDASDPVDEYTIEKLAAGATQTIALRARPHEEGYRSITAQLPADHLPMDDARTMVVRMVSQLKVLIVDGSVNAKARDADSFYLRHAMVPVAGALQNQYYIRITTALPTELDEIQFDGFDLVVFANVADCSPQSAESLTGYVHRGGGLLIFPGDAINRAFYNESLLARYQLLPATFGDMHGKADLEQDEKYFTLQRDMFQHPIMSLWSDSSSGSLQAARFYQAYELMPDGPSSRVVLSFGKGVGDTALDGKPCIIEKDCGLGRVMMFASTAGSKWNNLPVAAQGGIYVPLMDRIVSSMVNRQDRLLNLQPGKPFVFYPSENMAGKSVVFYKPGDTNAAADSRNIGLTSTDKNSAGINVTFDQTDIAGTYMARFPDDSTVRFAVQPDTASNESSLEKISKPQELKLSKLCQLSHLNISENLSAVVHGKRAGNEIWQWIIIGVLALAIVEMICAFRFGRNG